MKQKIYYFRRTISERETASVYADSLEEAWEAIEEGDCEYTAEPEESGPWDSTLEFEEGENSWDKEDTQIAGFWHLAPEAILEKARAVIESWEGGDLAGAVTALAGAIRDFDNAKA